MEYIDQAKNLKGKRVLLRADLSVPTSRKGVTNDFRIRRALPTIELLTKKGAKVVIVSHLGREGKTLRPVARRLNKYIPATFVPDITGKKAQTAVENMEDGDVIVLENVRREKGEGQNSTAFARKLAALADIYVNDAFAAAHRKHATLVALPKLLPAYAGLLMKEEIGNLSRAFKPKHPFLFVLGGAKFKTKLPLIKQYIKRADNVFIGGALAHTFFKVLGFPLGESRIEKTKTKLQPLLKNEKLFLPTDVVVSGKGKKVKRPADVHSGEKIVDAGPETMKELIAHIKTAKMILANGPLGFYEKGHDEGTKKMLRALAKSKAITIVGGGDTLALVTAMKLEDKFTFVSTGGGSMIAFLSGEKLPAIEALT